MDLSRFNEMLLASAGVALAVIDPDEGGLLFHNQRLAEWFPVVAEPGDEGPVGLFDLLPNLDRERLAKRMAAGRPYTAETEAKAGRRPVKLLLKIEPHQGAERQVWILECQNVTKMKELEYMIESYSKMVERQNRDLKKEKERVEKLLLNIMPKTVYEEWKTFGVTTPQRYDASVLMLDFVDFTEMTVSQDPPALIGELNDIFTAFDRIVENFGCERIKTLGDAYIAVSGIPEPTPEHAQNIAKVALRFVRYLQRRNQAHEQQWRCRIGINAGPVIGSIVGIQRYVYDIFGPAVNLAARMEAHCGPMEILLCEDMAPQLEGEFRLAEAGSAEIKGFGEKRLYRLVGDTSGGDALA